MQPVVLTQVTPQQSFLLIPREISIMFTIILVILYLKITWRYKKYVLRRRYRKETGEAEAVITGEVLQYVLFCRIESSGKIKHSHVPHIGNV